MPRLDLENGNMQVTVEQIRGSSILVLPLSEQSKISSPQAKKKSIVVGSCTGSNTMTDEGHAKVATLLSHHSELAIFRRFSKLNFQNLLYLQAELTHLEANLKKLVDRDAQNPNRQQYSRDWLFLAQNDDEHDDREQWDKFLQIRDKLKEYSMPSFS